MKIASYMFQAIDDDELKHTFDRRPLQKILDLTVERRIDRVGRYVVINFRQCWTRIKFRPFDPDRQPQVTHRGEGGWVGGWMGG